MPWAHKILVDEGEHFEVQDRDGLVAVYVGNGCSYSSLYTFPESYHKSLDAMHEAEKYLFTLNNWAACDYEVALNKITTSWAWHATAMQKAETFLKIINKKQK